MLNKSKATDVTAESLVEEGIIGKINDGIVVLATGKLDKKLNVTAEKIPAARFVYLFELNGEKATLRDFSVMLPQKQEETKAADKK